MRQSEQLPKPVTDVIETVIRQEMGEYGLKAVRATPGIDHDGDPIIWVLADYSDDGPPVDPNRMSAVLSKMRRELYEIDEDRMPHIRHNFSDNRQFVGFM